MFETPFIFFMNSILEEYMSETVDFVLTDEKWDQNFEDVSNFFEYFKFSQLWYIE